MNLIALQSSDFRRYYLGSATAVNGLWVLRVVIAWLAWEMTKSPSFVGLVASLSLIPVMLFGPFFGVWVDRTQIVRAASIITIGMIFCAFSLLMALLLNLASPTFLCGVSAAVGLVSAAHHPTRLSLGPRLVQRHQLSSVSALASINFNVARMAGPVLGGVAIERFGVPATLCIAIALYLPFLILVNTVSPRPNTQKDHEKFLSSLIEGFRYVYRSDSIKTALFLVCITSVSVRGLMELLPVAADGLFQKGAVGLGQLNAAIGAGAFGAALTKALGTSRMIDVLNPGVLALTLLAVIGVGIFGTSSVWGFSLTIAALMGFCTTFVTVTWQARVQTELPDEFRGRVMSLWMLVAMSMTAFGALAQGAMAELIGFGPTTVAVSILGLAALIWIAFAAKIRAKKEGG